MNGATRVRNSSKISVLGIGSTGAGAGSPPSPKNVFRISGYVLGPTGRRIPSS